MIVDMTKIVLESIGKLEILKITRDLDQNENLVLKWDPMFECQFEILKSGDLSW